MTEIKVPEAAGERYAVILADPPWSYDRKAGAGVADDIYNTMPLGDIKALPIGDLAQENAVLLLWATFPMLREALEVVEAWGFRYRTVAFNWIKLNRDGSPFFGIGHYTKSNSEICLLAVRGKGVPVIDNTISQVVMTVRRDHSRKPDKVYAQIEQLWGPQRRVELFARHRREGWACWGNQVPKETQVIL